MARGDVTTVMSANLALDGSVDRQPSAGVEEMILDVAQRSGEGTAPDDTPAVSINRIDGTNNDARLLNGDAGSGASSWFNMKMMADNTNYFRFINKGSEGDLTFAVIEVG